MRTIHVILLIIGLIAVAATLFVFLQERSSHLTPVSEQSLTVATTIFPLFDIAKNIIGDRAKVLLIVPSGSSPHTFETTPQKVKALQDTTIIFAIGVLDAWVDTLIESLPNAEKFLVNTNIQLRSSEEGEAYDPHYWLAIDNAKIIAQNMYQEIVLVDPANQEYYEENLQNFLLRLQKTDRTMRELLAEIRSDKIIVFHDSWNYFAQSYGLEIVAAFQPSPGKELAPRDLKNLFFVTEQYNIKVIFSEPQLPIDALLPFVEDLGLQLHLLDPLGGVKLRDSYIALMLYNASTIAEALK